MKKKETLHGVHHSSRADKMSGHGSKFKKWTRGISMKWMKRLYSKKRRQVLKTDDKI